MESLLSKGDLIEEKYLIIKSIGEGGMGEVFEAEHLLLKRKCAIKVLHLASAENRESILRFQAEAQSVANIRHPNIVEVMDFGIMPDGSPFFVMEYLVGESLASRLETKVKLSIRETVIISDAILSGLAAAHKNNIVHRDLKPDNIFIQKTPDHKEVIKILDFGISKILSSANVNEPFKKHNRPVTQQGMVMGTPGYMAPEVATGEPDIDARADIFSVGLLIYEMLTGRLPFKCSSPLELMSALATKPIPNPSNYTSEITVPMEQMILIALARQPEDRFQSSIEFLEYLTSAAVNKFPLNNRKCVTETGPPSILPRGKVLNARNLNVPSSEESKPPPNPPLSNNELPGLFASMPGSGGQSGTYLKKRRPAFGFRVHFSLFSVIFFLVLAAGLYYIFVIDKPLVVIKQRDPEKEELLRKRARVLEKEDSTAGGRSQNDYGKAIRKPEEKKAVTIWVDSVPHHISILWGTYPIAERPLIVPHSKKPVEVRFTAWGYVEQRRKIIPDKEQVLKIRLKKIRKKKRNKKSK